MRDESMHFDEEAQQWDQDPEKVKRANIFSQEIVEFIHPDGSMKAIDFGCGTGLLSFALRNNFGLIKLIDNSPGMIRVLEEKIKENKIKNFQPLCADPMVDTLNLKDFDIVYSSMTIHHIHDLVKIMNIFNSSLKMGGYLCIADLVTEDGTFHSEHQEFIGHLGFNKEKFCLVLEENGFEIVYYKIVFEIEKDVDGKNKKYPLFLVIGKKIRESN
jgi:ubiquinone/menaquinone biosynthesis C-methylase UbiE